MTSTEACGDLTPGTSTGIIFVPDQNLRSPLPDIDILFIDYLRHCRVILQPSSTSQFPAIYIMVNAGILQPMPFKHGMELGSLYL